MQLQFNDKNPNRGKKTVRLFPIGRWCECFTSTWVLRSITNRTQITNWTGLLNLRWFFFKPFYYVRWSSNEVISWRIELVYMPRQKLGLLGIFINSRLNLVRPHPAQHVPYRLLSSPSWRTSQKRKVPESWLPYTSSCHEQQQPILKKGRGNCRPGSPALRANPQKCYKEE